MDKEQPIGVFDSGYGGISVLGALTRILPGEDYLYYGDSQNAPYGTKSDEEIFQLAMQALNKLIDMKVKAVVIACNTVSSVAGKSLRQQYPDLIIVETEPAIKPAALKKKDSNVVVMATDATLRGGKFNRLLEGYKEQANIVKCPCPGLMDFVERGETDTPELHAYLRKRFAALNLPQIDAVVLGCTHYPFVKKAILAEAGEQTVVFDGAVGIANQLQRRLQQFDLLRERGEKGNVSWILTSGIKSDMNKAEEFLRKAQNIVL